MKLNYVINKLFRSESVENIKGIRNYLSNNSVLCDKVYVLIRELEFLNKQKESFDFAKLKGAMLSQVSVVEEELLRLKNQCSHGKQVSEVNKGFAMIGDVRDSISDINVVDHTEQIQETKAKLDEIKDKIYSEIRR